MALIAGMAARECLAVSASFGDAGVRAPTEPVDASTPGAGFGMRELLAVHVRLVDLVGSCATSAAISTMSPGTPTSPERWPPKLPRTGHGRAGGGRVDAALVDLRAVMALADALTARVEGRRRPQDVNGRGSGERTNGRAVGPGRQGDYSNADRA